MVEEGVDGRYGHRVDARVVDLEIVARRRRHRRAVAVLLHGLLVGGLLHGLLVGGLLHGLLVGGLLHGLLVGRLLHGLLVGRLLVGRLRRLHGRVIGGLLHGLVELGLRSLRSLRSLGLGSSRGGLGVKEGGGAHGHHDGGIADHVVALLDNFDICEENGTRITVIFRSYEDFTVFEEMIRIMVLFVIVPLSIS